MSVEDINSTEYKIKKLELLKAKKKMQDELPHLYGFKHYTWSRRFAESLHKLVFLSAPNQCGKSSQGIKKCIDFCTNPFWWGKVSKRPVPILGFYLYPDKGVARREIASKWVKEFLPKGDMINHPQYGWRIVDNKDKLSIIFNTGLEVYFLGYSQGKANILSMAASSPDFIFIDEEMPPELWPELSMRVEAVKGTIHFLATPVECYPLWRDIFNGTKKLPGALVMTVSMYDCVTFEDGTPGVYTKEDIKQRIGKLGTQAEIDKRVFGKYVTPEGVVFPSFDRNRNYLPPEDTKDWFLYGGVDPGSGGDAHPAAISIVAVNGSFTKGRVVKFWKGDQGGKTTAKDVLDKYIELTKDLQMTRQFYDWSSADFGTFAETACIPFEKAEKSHEIGIPLLNSLFKNDALIIDEHDDHLPLVEEIESLRLSQIKGAAKRHASDDGSDSLRYAISKLKWNVIVKEQAAKPASPTIKQDKHKYSRDTFRIETPSDDVFEEISFWNDCYEG